VDEREMPEQTVADSFPVIPVSFPFQIIPRAIDYFTGKALEYDDNMEELDDDEFDDEDFDDDVSVVAAGSIAKLGDQKSDRNP
jgi:hypothetical protein